MSAVVDKKQNYKLKSFIWLTVSGIVNAIGVTLFLAPVKLFDSGISGTAFLLDQLTHWGLWVFIILLNFPFFLISLRIMGKKFVVYSLYAITIYSVVSLIIQKFLPIDWSKGSPIVGSDKLLAGIFGGLISGIGSGLTIRSGGALDGVEVVAVMIAKKIGITVGTFVMIYNVLLYTVSAIIFKSWEIPLYSVIAYAIGVKAVDFIVEGVDKGKAAWIISDKAEDIAKNLSDNLFRGITVLDGKGYYSQLSKKILYIVVNRFEIARLKELVQEIDPKAFVSVSDISDTMGVNVRFRQNDYHKVKRQTMVANNKKYRVHNVDKQGDQYNYTEPMRQKEVKKSNHIDKTLNIDSKE